MSMREKLHPGNKAAQFRPSWPALWARVYVWCSSGSYENNRFNGNLQSGLIESFEFVPLIINLTVNCTARNKILYIYI